VDFYLPEENRYIEIDGEYWHPLNKENLNFQLISGFISEKKKEKINGLYRIRENDIGKIKSLNDLDLFSIQPNMNIEYYQKIISKSYFENYIKLHGKEKLESYVWLLLKFIKTFQPNFPDIPTTESLDNIRDIINKNKISFNENTKVFSNVTSNIGISYLKSIFKSYWKSRYIQNVSPVEAWNDENIMKDIIKYRIGINNTNEIFDFSLHQLVRGISARRCCISFFKPQVAANIYRYFLSDKINPIVIDPCAGFGGRLLGFKCVYPNGKYIGIEPTIETYNELKKLSENFTNVELYNCKLEDYKGSKDCDLTFTSIPYYNVEIYSNGYNMTENEWKNMVNILTNNYKNVLINISQKSYDIHPFNYTEKYYLESNTSHFDKINNKKLELILKV